MAMCHWHQIHSECLLGLFQGLMSQQEARDRPRFICQGKGCAQPLKPEAVRSVLERANGSLAAQLYQYRTKLTIVSDLMVWQELAFCPTPECRMFLVADKDSSIVICPKCKKAFCPHCCLRSHFNRPCVSFTYPLPRDRCVYCKQRQAVKEGCSRVVCYSDFCQGERAYCAVCLVGLPLEQESCRQCHPLNAEPLIDPLQRRNVPIATSLPHPQSIAKPLRVPASLQRQNTQTTRPSGDYAPRPAYLPSPKLLHKQGIPTTQGEKERPVPLRRAQTRCSIRDRRNSVEAKETQNSPR